MADPRETGRLEPMPRSPELDVMILLGNLKFQLWKLNGDIIHGADERIPERDAKLAEQSKIVLDVLSMQNRPRISVTTDQDAVALGWESLRPGDTAFSNRYRFSDLEGALAQDLRMYEAGRKGYERDEASNNLGTSGAHFLELAKHKRMKRIGLALQMHRLGMLSRVKVERARGKVRLTVPSDNPHFEPTDIEVKLKDLAPAIRKLVPPMPKSSTG